MTPYFFERKEAKFKAVTVHRNGNKTLALLHHMGESLSGEELDSYISALCMARQVMLERDEEIRNERPLF